MGLSHQIIGIKNMSEEFLYQAYNAIAVMCVDITGSAAFQKSNWNIPAGENSYSEKASKLLMAD